MCARPSFFFENEFHINKEGKRMWMWKGQDEEGDLALRGDRAAALARPRPPRPCPHPPSQVYEQVSLELGTCALHLPFP